MYSYDHDLEEFVAIGLGTVSEDGSVVASNTGVGVIKAGWHCGSQPSNSGCVSGKSCSFCKKSRTGDCSNNDCIEDLAKETTPLPADQQTAGDCQTKTCSGSVNNNSDVPDNDVQGDCKKPGCVNGEAKDVADDGDIMPEDQVCKKCEGGKLVALPANCAKTQNAQRFLDETIRPTLNELGLGGNAAEELLLGTAIQESDLVHRTQIGGGPALGLYQMEPDTHNDIWENFLEYRPQLKDRVSAFLTSEDKLYNLQHNDAYATAMARIHYSRVSSELPSSGDITGQAEYWKQHYNTDQGHGEVSDYINNCICPGDS
jgi:hypothetical protein